MSSEHTKPYFGEGIEPSRLMLTRESFCKVRIPSIIDKYGPMPERFQELFDNAMNAGTERDLHAAFMILDRWRFANLPRDKQIEEQRMHRENYEENLQEGFRLSAHPDDTADLITPENKDRTEWLDSISPTPSDGFKSLP